MGFVNRLWEEKSGFGGRKNVERHEFVGNHFVKKNMFI